MDRGCFKPFSHHLLFSCSFLGLLRSLPFPEASQRPRAEGSVVESPTASPHSTELNWEVDKKTRGQRCGAFGKWADGEPEKQRQGLRIQTESELSQEGEDMDPPLSFLPWFILTQQASMERFLYAQPSPSVSSITRMAKYLPGHTLK